MTDFRSAKFLLTFYLLPFWYLLALFLPFYRFASSCFLIFIYLIPTTGLEITHESKKALVTGASRGIGEAIALKLAKNGYNLVLTGRDLPKLVHLPNEVRYAVT